MVSIYQEVSITSVMDTGLNAIEAWDQTASTWPYAPASHKQPDVNYIQVLEMVDFHCTVNAQHLPFKGNQLRAETG